MSGPETKGKQPKAVASNRDNFNSKTYQRLRDGAGNVCSFPGCSVNTHGSTASGDGVVNLGVACHIKAAAPLGPRFDPEQTSDERRHYDNGIWMCQTHSRLIDADESNYSVAELLEWKREAEVRANAQLNQKSFTENEVKAAVDEGSIALLQRFSNMSVDPVNAPFAEVMRGYESSLQSLDPRFNVMLNKNGDSYTHVIQAIDEYVNLDLIIEDVDKIEGYEAAEKAFVEEGRELVIPSEHFRLKGSKLIEALHEKSAGLKNGIVTLGGEKYEMAATLYVRTPEGHEALIDTFEVYFTSGTVRTVFEGAALEGLFSVKAWCVHDGGRNSFDISFSPSSWRGKNILELPKFSRLIKAAKLLATGNFVVEIETKKGAPVFSARTSAGCDEFHSQIQWMIDYIELARGIAVLCAEPVLFVNTEMHAETYAMLRDYTRLNAGPVIGTRKPGMLCNGEFEYSDSITLQSLEEQGAFEVVRIADSTGVVFDLFGQEIKAPRIQRVFTKAEYFFFSDVESKGKPKFEVYLTEGSAVTSMLHPDDSWSVCESLDVSPEHLGSSD